MITHSESIKSIAAALLAFQGAVDGVKRDSDNPFFKSKYADLEKVVDTARPHLQAVGLSFLQSPGAIRDGNLEMTTMLIHAESGEWLQGTGEIPLGKKDPQGAGSAQTYAQRYHLMAMLGLPPTDDDGEGAMERPAPRPTPSKANLSSTRPVESPKTFAAYGATITAAKTPDDLKDAFAAIWKSPLSQEDKDTLKTAYEAKKVELANPGYVAPSFDNLQSEHHGDRV